MDRIIRILLISFIPGAFGAENPCQEKQGKTWVSKPDYEYRLDERPGSLADSKILDQDGLGVCYAAVASTVLQSTLTGNPEISYLQIALDYKKAETKNRNSGRLKVTRSTYGSTSDETLLDGGQFCEKFKEIKKAKLCPKDKVALENVEGDPSVQYEAFKVMGGFFDYSRKFDPQKRQKMVEGMKAAFGEMKKQAQEKCKEMPKILKDYLGSVHARILKRIEELEYEIPQMERSVSWVNELLSAKKYDQDVLASSIDQRQVRIDETAEQLQREIERKTRRSKGILGLLTRKKKLREIGSKIDRYEGKLKFRQDMQDEEMVEFRSLLEDIGEREKFKSDLQIDLGSARKELLELKASATALGSERPAPEYGIEGATEFEPDPKTEKKLEELFSSLTRNLSETSDDQEYSEAAKKTFKMAGIRLPESVRRMWDGKGHSLRLDSVNSTPDACFKGALSEWAYDDEHSREVLNKNLGPCANDRLDQSLRDMLQLASNVGDSLAVDAILGQMGKDPIQFVEKLIGSNCTPEDRISIPDAISCKNVDIWGMLQQNPNMNREEAARDPKFVSRVTSKFRESAFSALNQGRAAYLAVCGDFFDNPKADSKMGAQCKGGFHAVTIAGFACKEGRPQYLIQNSWGHPEDSDTGEPSVSNGRTWYSETSIIKNFNSIETLEGGAQ